MGRNGDWMRRDATGRHALERVPATWSFAGADAHVLLLSCKGGTGGRYVAGCLLS